MDYKAVIENSKINLNQNNWWIDFLYHFSDVHNIASILFDGAIYGRNESIKRSKMKFDNASAAVINVTSDDVKEYTRLYFRPKTPTQFHNEGYKPEDVRNSDINACCPVPVFLCLDMNSVLNDSDVFFAEKGLAGKGHELKQGIEAFSNLNFEKIYHSGWYDSNAEADIKEYRQTEVVKRGSLELEKSLKCILCRSVAEKDMLLYLLKKQSHSIYEKYKGYIMYRPKLDCFYKNGIFIEDVYWSRDLIEFRFNDKAKRNNNTDDVLISFSIDIKQYDINNVLVDKNYYTGLYSYATIESLKARLFLPSVTKHVIVCVKLDECIMYENDINIEEMEVV